MNTRIIKKIAKSMQMPNTHGTFMIQGDNGIVLSLDAGYCFNRPDFITEDGIYKAEYLADNIAVKTDQPLDDYPDFDADQLTTDIKIRVTDKQIKELLKFASKDTNRPQLTGVTLYIHDDQARLIATDGYSMAWDSVKIYGQNTANNYVLSGEFLNLAAMLDEYLVIHINKDYTWIKINDELLFSRNLGPLEDNQLNRFLTASTFETTTCRKCLTKIPDRMKLDLTNNILITPDDKQTIDLTDMLTVSDTKKMQFSIKSNDTGVIIMPLSEKNSNATIDYIQLRKLRKTQICFYYNPDRLTPIFIRYIN